MPDTKKDREDRADGERRRPEGETTVRSRDDEAEPPDDAPDGPDEARRADDGSPDSPRKCHRRGCDEPPTFVVLERYQEETGKGAVEAEALLCREHATEESPANLDAAYPDYVFRVEPIAKTRDTDAA